MDDKLKEANIHGRMSLLRKSILRNNLVNDEIELQSQQGTYNITETCQGRDFDAASEDEEIF